MQLRTQALANPYFGPWALELLEKGKKADEVLKVILKRDTSCLKIQKDYPLPKGFFSHLKQENQQPVKELRREYELWQYAFLAPAYLRLSKEEKDK